MKKILTTLLAVLLLQTAFVHQTFAETKEERFAGKVKTEITKIGIGQDAKVKLKLRDGAKIKGFISEIGDNQFSVTNTETGQVTQVAYPNVKQVKGNNLSTGIKIAIGVAVLIVVVLIAGSALK